MHESIWPERRFAGITSVNKPTGTLADGHRVSRAQLHEQIVWMLSVDQNFAFVSFAGLEKQRRATRWKRERLGAEHAAQLECARTNTAHSGRHEPVCRFSLRDTSWSTLTIHTGGEVVMKHQQPLARLLVQHRHRARRRLPRRAGTHATHRYQVRLALDHANEHLI